MELLEIKLSFFPLLLGEPFKHGIMLDTNKHSHLQTSLHLFRQGCWWADRGKLENIMTWITAYNYFLRMRRKCNKSGGTSPSESFYMFLKFCSSRSYFLSEAKPLPNYYQAFFLLGSPSSYYLLKLYVFSFSSKK